MLNTIAAEELKQFADALDGAGDMEAAAVELVRRTVIEHRRIIFNGDGCSEEWVAEAERRGLLNLRTTVDAMPRYMDEKNVKLFGDHHIYTRAEMQARYETTIEEYAKTVRIEALDAARWDRDEVIPAMESLRSTVDAMEADMPSGAWPYPTYGELMFKV